MLQIAKVYYAIEKDDFSVWCLCVSFDLIDHIQYAQSIGWVLFEKNELVFIKKK